LQDFSIYFVLKSQNSLQKDLKETVNYLSKLEEKYEIKKVFFIFIQDEKNLEGLPKNFNSSKYDLNITSQNLFKQKYFELLKNDPFKFKLMFFNCYNLRIEPYDLKIKDEKIKIFLNLNENKDRKKKAYVVEKDRLCLLHPTKKYLDFYEWTGALFFEKTQAQKALQKLDDKYEELRDSTLNLEDAELIKTYFTKQTIKKDSNDNQKLKPCLFLDRDGIIIEDTSYPHKIKDI